MAAVSAAITRHHHFRASREGHPKPCSWGNFRGGRIQVADDRELGFGGRKKKQ